MRKLFAAIFLLILTSGASFAQIGLPFPGPGTAHNAGGGGGPFVFITSAKTTSFAADNVTTASFDSTGGDFIVGCWSAFTGGTVPTGVSDNKSNTYSLLTAANSTNQNLRCFYNQGGTVGTGHTVSTTGGVGDFPAMAVAVFSGSIASPLDQQGQNSCTPCSTMFASSGALTPGVTAELFVAGLSSGATGAAISIDSSFTIPANGNVPFTSGTNEGATIAYKIKTNTTSEQPIWTSSVLQTDMAAAMATFKP